MNRINEYAQDEALVAEAYERVKEELAALKEEELAFPNLDVQAAVRTVLGSLAEIRKAREGLMKELSGFDVVSFDKLEDYTQALSWAHAKYQVATEEPNEIEELFAEATKHRERLILAGKGLVPWGLFNQKKLDKLKHGNGYNNVAQDLQALSAAFEEAWPDIQGKTPMVKADVTTASRVALRLTRLLGEREQGEAKLAEATERRQRAFTLFSRTYEEVRAGLAYLRRRTGDADSIAPNLYSGVSDRPASVRKEGDAAVTGDGKSAPSAAGGGAASSAVSSANSEAAKLAISAEDDDDGPFVKS